MKRLSILSVFAVIFVVCAQNQYCDFTPQHSLCNNGIGPKCGATVPLRGVSDSDKALIVQRHNILRQWVAIGKEWRGVPGPQPSASNMREMEWDDELAAVAQSHADKCIPNHECNECRKVSRFGVGQNLSFNYSTEYSVSSNWHAVIDDWYNEVKLVNPVITGYYQFSTSIGHYTQIVWWNTWKIGCGLSMYRYGDWWAKHYTCDYGPAGNTGNQEMYKTGQHCSACPSGTTCSTQYSGLCASTGSSNANSDINFGSNFDTNIGLDYDTNFDTNVDTDFGSSSNIGSSSSYYSYYYFSSEKDLH